MNWKRMFKGYEKVVRELSLENETPTYSNAALYDLYNEFIENEIDAFENLGENIYCEHCNEYIEPPLVLELEYDESVNDYPDNIGMEYMAVCPKCGKKTHVPYFQEYRKFINECLTQMHTDAYMYVKQKRNKTYDPDV